MYDDGKCKRCGRVVAEDDIWRHNSYHSLLVRLKLVIPVLTDDDLDDIFETVDVEYCRRPLPTD